MTKTLRKAIMRRSALQNRFYRDGLQETEKAFKKQRNYTKRLLKKEKKRYFSNLNMNNYTDNKKFWNTVKPLFSNYGGPQKITLIEDENIITSEMIGLRYKKSFGTRSNYSSQIMVDRGK